MKRMSIVFLCLCPTLCFGKPVSASLHYDYTEYSCAVEDNYAVIEFKQNNEINDPSAHQYSINFQPLGLIVRFPPDYYAPDWDETTVEFDRERPNSMEGVLVLELNRSKEYEKEVVVTGKIKKVCWEMVKKFVKQRIAAQGIIVHLTEKTQIR